MRLNIQFEPVSSKHIQAATDLVVSAYQEERLAIPFLPDDEECSNLIHDSIVDLFQTGTGIAAYSEGEFVGFLAGWEIREFWGKEKGIYCPLFGHGAVKQFRSRIYQAMYEYAADLWVKKGLLSHAATFYPHDEETIKTWFWLGFGLRCVDAIRKVAPIDAANPEIRIKKAEPADMPAMAQLGELTDKHLRQTPMFMPLKPSPDPVGEMTEWMQKDNRHAWIAYRGDKPVGYMKIKSGAETFVSHHSSIMNITGAFVHEDERGSGVGALLVDAIQQWLAEHGYPLCGVDFESFNIPGGNFWTRHFTPYTYSLTRRIDERILMDK